MKSLRYFAIAALLLAPQLAFAQGKTGIDRLYVLDCGQGTAADMSRWTPGENVNKPMDVVDNCYLIHHTAGGYLLWDTGVTDAIAGRAEGPPSTNGAPNWRKPKTLAGQLEQLGVKPADIKYLAISHTHPDHIGNVELFPQSTLLVQKAEYEWPSPLGVGRFKPEHAVNKLNGDHDVFGDGSVTIISTPGHTPGPSVTAGQAAEDRRAAAVGRRGALQGQLGQAPGAGRQYRQGQDRGLDGAHGRGDGTRKGPALDQSRQGAGRHAQARAGVLRLTQIAAPGGKAGRRYRLETRRVIWS